jgi:hypothetical protein
METYPDIITGIPARLPFRVSTQRAVLKTEFENGVEQRRALWNAPRRDVRLNYPALSFAQGYELKRFYEARGGSFERFNFYFPHPEAYVYELVGLATQALGTFDLPSLEATSYTLYRNGTALTEGVDWTFVLGTPPAVPDKAILIGDTTTPGDVFHFDFTGRLRIITRFDDNPFQHTEIKNYLVYTTVSLKGLAPDPLESTP